MNNELELLIHRSDIFKIYIFPNIIQTSNKTTQLSLKKENVLHSFQSCKERKKHVLNYFILFLEMKHVNEALAYR